MENGFVVGKATEALGQHIPVDHLRALIELYRVIDKIFLPSKGRGRPRDVALNFLIYNLYKKLEILLWGNDQMDGLFIVLGCHRVDKSELSYTKLLGAFLAEQSINQAWTSECNDDSYRQGLRTYISRILKRHQENYRDVIPYLMKDPNLFIEPFRSAYQPLCEILPDFHQYCCHYLKRYHHSDARVQRIIAAFESEDSFRQKSETEDSFSAI